MPRFHDEYMPPSLVKYLLSLDHVSAQELFDWVCEGTSSSGNQPAINKILDTLDESRAEDFQTVQGN